MRIICTVLALSLTISFSSAVFGADWPTFGHDPQRSGFAFDESTLTVNNVGQLELKWKARVKNEPKSLTALTAPVVAEDVDTAHGMKTMVYVGGSDNHLYALDAADGSVIWSRDFEVHVLPKDAGMWLCPNGVNATPVIDRGRNLIYAIAVDGRLWGLDLGTGKPRFGPAQFVPAFSKNWSLNLVDGVIYTSISQGCGDAQSGIYSMDIRDPMRPAIRSLLVSKRGGAGIWGRGGPTIGANERLYAATGDGEFDASQGQYGSSVIAASLDQLRVVDYYRPTNYRDVTKYDLDMGSTSLVWFSVKDFNLVASGGKEGVLYMLDADHLGTNDHQTALYHHPMANDERSFEQKGIWGGLAAWRDEDEQTWLYVPVWGAVSAKAPKFPVSNGSTPRGCIAAFKVVLESGTKKPTLEPAWVSGDLNVPEPPVIANGVVFAVSTGENTQQTTGPTVIYAGESAGQKLLSDVERGQNTHNTVLYALDARTGKTLYQSGNAMSTWVHFSGPALANGRIYAVDHDSQIYCFGLKEEKAKPTRP
jgi:outer membrane protein assembly factor BamB